MPLPSSEEPPAANSSWRVPGAPGYDGAQAWPSYKWKRPGRLAQLGERQLDKLEVTGSSPVAPIPGRNRSTGLPSTRSDLERVRLPGNRTGPQRGGRSRSTVSSTSRRAPRFASCSRTRQRTCRAARSWSTLTDCDFIDSTGLATLLHGAKPAQNGESSVALVSRGGEVRKLLELTAIDRTIPVFDTLDEAVVAVLAVG